MEDPPTITILLLGDAECGKSTFLSRISRGGVSPHPHHPAGSDSDSEPIRNTNSKTTTEENKTPLRLRLLRDLDQPFIYNVRTARKRHYRLEFYDTAAPDNYTLLNPDFVIICYAIDDRQSLVNAQQVWRKNATRLYMRERDNIPVMLLGLKRDLRVEEEGVIYPQEAYAIAQAMRCDRYAECSALTGELINEVFEDIARTAVKTTTEAGGLSENGCAIL